MRLLSLLLRGARSARPEPRGSSSGPRIAFGVRGRAGGSHKYPLILRSGARHRVSKDGQQPSRKVMRQKLSHS